jgi:predicted Ser/Thr protein kinase
MLQSSILTKYRSFYAFLQRHAARSAHEVQKAYVSTAQWYYETGFRRYVRALERIRAKSYYREEPIGSATHQENPLSMAIIVCLLDG